MPEAPTLQTIIPKNQQTLDAQDDWDNQQGYVDHGDPSYVPPGGTVAWDPTLQKPLPPEEQTGDANDDMEHQDGYLDSGPEGTGGEIVLTWPATLTMPITVAKQYPTSLKNTDDTPLTVTQTVVFTGIPSTAIKWEQLDFNGPGTGWITVPIPAGGTFTATFTVEGGQDGNVDARLTVSQAGTLTMVGTIKNQKGATLSTATMVVTVTASAEE